MSMQFVSCRLLPRLWCAESANDVLNEQLGPPPPDSGDAAVATAPFCFAYLDVSFSGAF